MAWDTAGKGKLLEQAFHAVFVLRNVGIDFAVSSFQVSVCNEARPAVAGTCDVDDVKAMIFYDPVQVDVDEIKARRRSPMSKQARLYMHQRKRLPEQWIVVKIYLANRKVIGRPPIGIKRF